jgi:hypothetical protein
MVASFGKSLHNQNTVTDFLIKEVRVWSDFITIPQIEQWRYRQIDPTNTGNRTLQSYFRLASGTTLPYNLAEQMPNYNFTNSNPVLLSAKLVSSYKMKTEYVLKPNSIFDW